MLDFVSRQNLSPGSLRKRRFGGRMPSVQVWRLALYMPKVLG